MKKFQQKDKLINCFPLSNDKKQRWNVTGGSNVKNVTLKNRLLSAQTQPRSVTKKNKKTFSNRAFNSQYNKLLEWLKISRSFSVTREKWQSYHKESGLYSMCMFPKWRHLYSSNNAHPVANRFYCIFISPFSPCLLYFYF